MTERRTEEGWRRARRLGGVEFLDAAEIVARAQPASILCGVYFLVSDGIVVYVGQSIDVLSRIGAHARSGKRFDSFAFVATRPDQLEDAELEYIQRFRPSLNKKTPTCAARSGLTLPSSNEGVAAIASSDKPVDYRDQSLPRGSGSLVLRVHPSKKKRWYFIFNIPNAERRGRGMRYRRATVLGGEFPIVSIHAARAWAEGLRAKVVVGIDPRSQPRMAFQLRQAAAEAEVEYSGQAAALRQRMTEGRSRG